MTPEQEKLREQFAMHAMQGILANDVCMRETLNRNDNPDIVADAVARRAFIYADAMMAKKYNISVAALQQMWYNKV